MATRLGLGDMLRAAPRALGRYTGTLLAVFIVQSIVAVGVMLGVAFVLTQMFGDLPMFDEAVDGDLVALLYCLRHGKEAMLACAGIVVGGVLMWQLATWFLVGGINGVLANRPEGRGDTARCFGAAGASTYLAYVRLGLCALPGLFIVLLVLFKGLALMDMDTRLLHALTVPQLLGPFIIATLPAFVLLHILWTVTDYARVELTLRGESHEPSVVATYVRTIAYVVKRPITLAHGALGWLAFMLVTIGYMYLSQGHPMYGAEGAVTLFVIRQGVALARHAIRFGVIAGQVELAKTRPLPPRRIEPKVADKKT